MKRNLFLIPPLLTLAACGGSSSSDDAAARTSTPEPVSIEFAAVVAADALACDTDYSNVGSANSTTQIKDFRFYVHDVYLITDSNQAVAITLDNNDWQAQQVAMLDFEDASGLCTGTTEINTVITGTVPDDSLTFTGVGFTLGVPEDLNHPAQNSVSPLNVTGLQWSWLGGYKFLRMDVPDWNIHIGSTGCTSTAPDVKTCSNSNRPQIELDNFDYTTQVIQLDFAALVQDNDISTNIGGAAGCMSGTTDPECNGIFTQLGLELASGDNDATLTQTVFSAVTP
jgi:uncharacterized repeat protein (TIGR04052 family)